LHNGLLSALELSWLSTEFFHVLEQAMELSKLLNATVPSSFIAIFFTALVCQSNCLHHRFIPYPQLEDDLGHMYGQKGTPYSSQSLPSTPHLLPT
jgi:hypothetical protein